MIRTLALAFSLLLSTILLFAAADGAWLARVPAREHQKSNPFRDQAEAAAAGHRLFTDHCAPCHGRNAEGIGKKPSLRSGRVQQQATEGDLRWLLVNGNLRRGMPSWSRLPDPELWQLVTYLRSLHE
jgi:mono/diheme cytochrome c family protein